MADEAREECLRLALDSCSTTEHTRRAGLLLQLAELLDNLGREEECEELLKAAAEVSQDQLAAGRATKAKRPPSPTSGERPTRFRKREYMTFEQRHIEPCHHTVVGSRGPVRELSLEQAPFSAEGFASTVWDSAVVLAKYLESIDLNGKTVVELGAGCGLPGIAAVCLGARTVHLTDLAANLPLLRRNAERNVAPYARRRLVVAPLVWGEEYAAEDVDYVLAADVLYLPDCAADLAQTTTQLMAREHPCRALIACGRNRTAQDRFMSAVKAHGVSVRVVPAGEQAPDFVCDDVELFELRRS